MTVIDLAAERERREPKYFIDVQPIAGLVVVGLDPGMVERDKEGRIYFVIPPGYVARFVEMVQAAEVEAEGQEIT